MLRLIIVNSYCLEGYRNKRRKARFFKKVIQPSVILHKAWNRGEIILESCSDYSDFLNLEDPKASKYYENIIISFAYSKDPEKNAICSAEADNILKTIKNYKGYGSVYKIQANHSNKKISSTIEDIFKKTFFSAEEPIKPKLKDSASFPNSSIYRILLVNKHSHENSTTTVNNFVNTKLPKSEFLYNSWLSGDLIINVVKSDDNCWKNDFNYQYNLELNLMTKSIGTVNMKNCKFIFVVPVVKKKLAETKYCVTLSRKILKSLQSNLETKNISSIVLDNNKFSLSDTVFESMGESNTPLVVNKNTNKIVYTYNYLKSIFSLSNTESHDLFKQNLIDDFENILKKCSPVPLYIVKRIFTYYFENYKKENRDDIDELKLRYTHLFEKTEGFTDNRLKYLRDNEVVVYCGGHKYIHMDKLYRLLNKESYRIRRHRTNKGGIIHTAFLKKLLAGTYITKENYKLYQELILNFYNGLCEIDPNKKKIKNELTLLLAKLDYTK